MNRLMMNIEEYGKDMKRTAQKAQHKAFECLGLLMILDKAVFKKHLGMLIGYVKNEQNDRKKSSMIYAAIKCLFDCVMINGFMVETNEEDT